MVYKKFGYVFRQIREQKHISLSDFSSIGISKATLSRFERAETMMNFEKVVQALQLMGIGLEEYEYLLNDYAPNESEYLLKEIETAFLKQDKKELNNLHKIALEAGYPYISLAAKSSYTELSPENIDTITDYLYDIKVWGQIELYVFYFTMNKLNIRDILYILDLFLLEKKHKIFNSVKYLEIFVCACCRAIALLASKGYQEYSAHILNRVEALDLVQSMFLRNLLNLSKGFWTYRFKDEKAGNQMMLQALEIFHLIGNQEIAGYYQQQYDFHVKKGAL
ncbi:Rgg/GadR/MutR family transcriptional regulator [Lactococcus formosensis]|jgi:transcriptional activator, Rgg/GadR/MutR family, C-terminal domain|uniref:Helix-turn-helix domain-containing protein n=2 Tax=Lactococcus formosensis TaxID=1281486 RepID=A0A9X4NX65_9LACT|nr:Rgg/GadR/MutR family transcriptional regulator [Lactococcus formosensis]MCO7180890.1 helix-turn-helix domain-containing protein [Lactococcus formosensis]MDG6119916.1 helix-turn-helix domain-containing protein [Lactococcus formosensis]MDG6126926.1 helix-turn-helix domain-containing protein [Lactococcus formosensis]MDG6133165.1 helix-turn-helix domain-containing protein [Lactococcus formosensis]MDG6134950.1 helix-turn-helix domain-containing protein [Lactococcus formosensis]